MSNADYQIFEDIIQEMMMVYRHDNRPWLIGYSGGKDSTLLVSLVFRAVSRIPENERNKKVYVITSDTMVENGKFTYKVQQIFLICLHIF